LAIEAAPAAIPVKPNSAATNAITRKISDQRNILISFRLKFYLSILKQPANCCARMGGCQFGMTFIVKVIKWGRKSPEMCIFFLPMIFFNFAAKT
jgi:hypothetical protein